MNLKKTASATALLTALALVANAAAASELHEHDHRQHGSHVHGIAALNLVLEGREVHLELDSPAANIVGFEHAPSSTEDHAVLNRAATRLRDADRLFRFDEDAGCRPAEASITSALLDGRREAQAPSADHSPAQTDTHEHEGHANIEAMYRFECEQPGRLTQLRVELFDAFPHTQRLMVQYVIEHRQGASELTATDPVVRF